MDNETIEREALRMAPAKRAELAQKLILSLDVLPEAETDAAWLDEAQERALELDDGRVQPVSAAQVRRKAQDLLR